MNEPVLACRGLAKTYTGGPQDVAVLTGVDLAVAPGERIAIVGASGSGKSTLLHLLGGLDLPSAGEVTVEGRAFGGLSEAERGRVRNRALGFIYQFHHLLPEFTAVENVAMPLAIRRTPAAEARRQARAMLERVGLGHRLDHVPGELSGGERQRVALARALAADPRLLIADEPTSMLDASLRADLMALLRRLARERGLGVLLITHDLPSAAAIADRVLVLRAGRVVEEGPAASVLTAPAHAYTRALLAAASHEAL